MIGEVLFVVACGCVALLYELRVHYLPECERLAALDSVALESELARRSPLQLTFIRGFAKQGGFTDLSLACTRAIEKWVHGPDDEASRTQ